MWLQPNLITCAITGWAVWVVPWSVSVSDVHVQSRHASQYPAHAQLVHAPRQGSPWTQFCWAVLTGCAPVQLPCWGEEFVSLSALFNSDVTDNFFYWNIVDRQYYTGFKCTTCWFDTPTMTRAVAIFQHTEMVQHCWLVDHICRYISWFCNFLFTWLHLFTLTSFLENVLIFLFLNLRWSWIIFCWLEVFDSFSFICVLHPWLC